MNLKEVASLITYENEPLISLTTNNMSFSFEVPEQVLQKSH